MIYILFVLVCVRVCVWVCVVRVSLSLSLSLSLSFCVCVYVCALASVHGLCGFIDVHVYVRGALECIFFFSSFFCVWSMLELDGISLF